MTKKSEGLPITVIIVAVLALAVLIIFITWTSTSASIFSKSTFTCESKNGQCVETGKCNYQATSFTCPTKEQPICCVNPSGG